MTDPTGFLKVDRTHTPKRPVAERVRDYQHVYTLMPREQVREQASRCMGCGVPFCTSGCPLGNLIPDWNDLVYRDRRQAAFERLDRTNNFPEFTGMLCPAPCEASCVLTIDSDAVAIKDIELSIVDRAFEEGWIRPRPPETRTGRRVAVIGSGPAGLAAAQQLNRAGHTVTVFERDDQPGGLLRYGIPDFKLEKWVVDRRLRLLEAEGIEFRCNVPVGDAIGVDELRAKHDAVLLAVGALQPRDLDVPGRGLAGVHQAMEYLVQQNRRVAGEPVLPGTEITARGKRVVILGGGDTGADCLGNVHREGAVSARVVTWGPPPPVRRAPGTWPDWPAVLRTYPAHEEGGERVWATAVRRFIGRDGHVTAMHTVDVERTAGGPALVSGSDRVESVDLVLLAIGFEGPVRDRALADLGVSYTVGGVIAANPGGWTGVPGVWAAGDATRGASLIVWAIAEGRRAAAEIDGVLAGI